MSWAFVGQVAGLFIVTFLFAVAIVEYAIWRSDR